KKVHAGQNVVKRKQERGHLDHRTDLDGLWQIMIVPPKWVSSFSKKARAWSNSETVATIGNMMRNSRPGAASRSARNWLRRSAGRSRLSRIARQPISVFSSSMLRI